MNSIQILSVDDEIDERERKANESIRLRYCAACDGALSSFALLWSAGFALDS